MREGEGGEGEGGEGMVREGMVTKGGMVIRKGCLMVLSPL